MQPLIQEVLERSKELDVRRGGIVGPIRYSKIKFWELFLYLSEMLMSKNKTINWDKYHYKKVYNDWDDSTGSDF
jgi:hypothetical protein